MMDQKFYGYFLKMNFFFNFLEESIFLYFYYKKIFLYNLNFFFEKLKIAIRYKKYIFH